MSARVIEHRARLDFCELGLVDETDDFELLSGRLVLGGFLPGAALVECRRDSASFGLSVPFVFADRVDEAIDVWLVLSLPLLVPLLLLLLVRLPIWMALGMAVVLAEFRDGRKNPGAGIDRVGVEPARRLRSSTGLGAVSISGDDAASVPLANVRRIGRADGRTTACIGDMSSFR